MGKNITTSNENLCKNCKYRHRRVFLLINPNEYLDEDDEKPFEDKKDPVVMISNFCLITGLEISGEITIECSNYEEKNDGISFIEWKPEQDCRKI